jgi:putative hydrolase
MLFNYFNNINDKYVLQDFHLHSSWTDGICSLDKIVSIALSRRLRTIAFTDHVRRSSTYFPDYLKEIDRLRNTVDICLLAGFEAKVANMDGTLDVSRDIIEASDVRIGSVHSFPVNREFITADRLEAAQCFDMELSLSLSMLNNPDINVIGHPGGMSIKYHGTFPLKYFEKIIEACAQKGVAFELNLRSHADLFPTLDPLLRKYNPRISLGSDAHDEASIGGWARHEPLIVALACGIH